MNGNSVRLTNKLKILEQEMHNIKQQIIELFHKEKKVSVVKKTIGILKNKIPEGVQYQKKMRQEFENHFNKTK